MADNVAITAGTGTTIAADDIGGVLHQRVKISQGADGAASDVSGANPLPVSLLSSISVSALNAGGSLSAFQGGAWNVGNIGGSLSAWQGGNWLVSVATLPVIANINNSSIPVTQSGTWDEVGINDSGNSITIDGNVGVIGGSLSAWAAGGSLSAFQGGSWNVGINAGTNNIGDVDILSIAAGNNNIGDVDAIQSGTWTVQPGNTPNTTAWLVTMATLPVVGNFSLSGAVANAGGSVSAWAAGGSLSAFQGGTWTVQPGNTPNTVAWLVTMATLPVVTSVNVAGQATVTALQGDAGSSAWRVTMATLPVVANINNTSIAVTQSGTWDEVGINDSGNSITIDGNVGVIGGSLSVYIFGGSISAFNAGGSLSAVNIGGSLSAFQGGSWTVANAGGSVSSYVFGGSLSAFNVGGSLSAFQGGTWNVFSSLASGTSFIGAGQYRPTLASLNSMDFAALKTDLFSNLMVNTNVPLPNSTKLNRFYTYASMASLMAAPGAGKRLVVREFDFSGNATVSIKLVEDHAGTPATVWGPHYFLPYGGIVKPQTYIPLTANKSLGVDITGTSFNSGLDIRVETENS